MSTQRGARISETANRRQLRDRLNKISGIDIPEDRIGRRPSVPMVALEQRAVLDQFLGVFDWYFGRIRDAV